MHNCFIRTNLCFYHLFLILLLICQIKRSSVYRQASEPSLKNLVNASAQRIKINFISTKLSSNDLFSVVVRIFLIKVLSGIIQLVARNWKCCLIDRSHDSKTILSVQRIICTIYSCLSTFFVRCRLSWSRLHVIDNFFIHRISMWEKILWVGSFIGKSYLRDGKYMVSLSAWICIIINNYVELAL